MARKTSARSGNAELLRQFVDTFGTWDEMLAPVEAVPSELRAESGQVDLSWPYVPWRPLEICGRSPR